MHALKVLLRDGQRVESQRKNLSGASLVIAGSDEFGSRGAARQGDLTS